MLTKYETNNKIDSYIDKLAEIGIVSSFYPNAINKALNIPLTSVLERLGRLVDDEILELKFEIRCHKGSHVIAIIDDYGKLLEKEEFCMFCGEEIFIDLSNISPIYYIKDEYKKHLKKKKKLNLVSTTKPKSKRLPITI